MLVLTVKFSVRMLLLYRTWQAFEMAGTRRPSLDSVEDNSVAGFTCLRIDGQVPTALR